MTSSIQLASRRSFVRVLLVVFLVWMVHPTPTSAKDQGSHDRDDLQKQQEKAVAAAAKRKQRRDARMVHKVLRAASHDDPYAVLGLRNWEIQIPSRTWVLTKKYQLTLPGLRLLAISTDRIKRAYRARAVAVHPDKNRDPKAHDAFLAVEHSLSLLTHPQRRHDYDQARRLERRQRRHQILRRVSETLGVVWGTLQKILATVKSVLGPFALPVLILGALII